MGSQMTREFPLHPGERIRTWQVPHPLSVLHLYLFGSAVLLWSVALFFLYSSEWWNDTASSASSGTSGDLGETVLILVTWLLFPLAIGILAFFRKKRGIILIFLVLVLPVGILFFADLASDSIDAGSDFYSRLTTSYGLLVGVLSLMAVDFYRHSVRYYFTNRRVILSKKLLTHRLRTIPYDDILKVDIEADWFDQLFDVGTLVLELGTDETQEATPGTGQTKQSGSFFFPGDTITGIIKPSQLLERLGLDEGEES